jgi:hypothetical protein
MFQSHLSDIVEFQGRAKTATRLFRQFKISCQKIEILARVVDEMKIARQLGRQCPRKCLLSLSHGEMGSIALGRADFRTVGRELNRLDKHRV